MRRLALAAAVATLVAGAAVSAAAGVALAQASDPPAKHFTVACHQVRCVFDASNATLDGGEIETYEWAFGDGDTATGQVVNHAYASGGTYNVTLTLEGENGTTEEETRQIRVFADREASTDVPWAALAVGVVTLGGAIGVARAT